MRLNATRLGSIASSRSFGDQLYDLAGQVPPLDLNFAQNKSLIDDYSGTTLVTFTRASSATFTGSNGLIQTASTNEPRFDHNPTTGESLGLLVEEARTNLLLRNEEFDNASWQLFGTTSRTANTTVAPNGTITADSVTLPASSGIYQIVNGLANTAYTFSIWIRCDTTQSVRLVINTNLSDPIPLTVTATSTWQRFNITKTTSVGTTTITSQIDTGGGNTFFLWGAQLEAGAFPTSYIPTTTATVTRAADVASITGSNFSSWYNQTEGTVFVDAVGVNIISGATRRYLEISDGTTSERTFLGYSSASNGRFFITDNGTTQADINVTSTPSPKMAAGYVANGIQMAANGVLGTEDTSANLPTVNRLILGSQDLSTANTFLNGHIRRLTFWPQRLANSTLQTLTQ